MNLGVSRGFRIHTGWTEQVKGEDSIFHEEISTIGWEIGVCAAANRDKMCFKRLDDPFGMIESVVAG